MVPVGTYCYFLSLKNPVKYKYINWIYIVATIRLLFFHTLQPIMYCIVLYTYQNQISHAQYILGCIVAVREGFNFFFGTTPRFL
jgi:hypothetical protein